MGTPTCVDKHNYPTDYKVKDIKGVWHVQCNCIVLVTAKKAEERKQAEIEVGTSYVDLYRIDSSQSQRSDNPPSPPHRRKKKHSEDREDVHSVDDDDYDYDDGGGGKRGGGGNGGGGKRKKGF